MADKLAILGGSQAVTVPAKEQWQPPNDRIKALIGEMIDRGAYSVAGAYIPQAVRGGLRQLHRLTLLLRPRPRHLGPVERLLRRRRRPG